MATDIDQRLRDIQREYLDFLDDDVSYDVLACILKCTTLLVNSHVLLFLGATY